MKILSVVSFECWVYTWFSLLVLSSYASYSELCVTVLFINQLIFNQGRPWSKARQCGKSLVSQTLLQDVQENAGQSPRAREYFHHLTSLSKNTSCFSPLYLTSIWPCDCSPEAYFPQKEHTVNQFCIVSCQWLIVRRDGSYFAVAKSVM